MASAWGLVVGKFYPPHAGHIALVRHAIEARGGAVVLVLGSPLDAMSPQSRAAAIAAELIRQGCDAASFELLPGIDAAPMDLNDDTVWASHVALMADYMRSANHEVDTLVASEKYGEELAARLGLRLITFDMARLAHPMSGTSARADLVASWSRLPASTRAELCTRVVLLGAESTGTSTIARRLREALAQRGGVWQSTQLVLEYGREVSEERITEVASGQFSSHWDSGDFEHIALTQQAREDDLAGDGSPVLVCDTDAFATAIWEKRYIGEAARLRGTQLGRGDVYLLTDHVGVPFIQDGLRDGEHIREEMTRWFADALIAGNRPWAFLVGDEDERLGLALKIVDEVSGRKLNLNPPY